MKKSPVWFTAFGFLLLAGGPTGVLGATSAQKCTGAKIQALGKAIDARAQCQAKARKSGDAVDPECLSKADAKLREQFAKAEKAGACPGDADVAVAVATACVTSFDGAVAGDASCVAAKIKAAGKKAAGKTACAKKNTLKGAALAPCLAKVESKFAKAVAKAEQEELHRHRRRDRGAGRRVPRRAAAADPVHGRDGSSHLRRCVPGRPDLSAARGVRQRRDDRDRLLLRGRGQPGPRAAARPAAPTSTATIRPRFASAG